MRLNLDTLRGARVTVMGLGLHGGGIASARFLASAGAQVTVTDLRGPEVLAPSLQALENLPIRFVLGKHEMDDFVHADFVVKNPAVKRDSPYLQAARHIETDISLFLKFTDAPLIAVTGSKGKSTTSSAIYHCLRKAGLPAFLGGNITVSPLEFLHDTAPETPVVLELSSWQLGDLRGTGLLKPKVAVLTTIVPDHLNYYGSMESYVYDKREIYRGQDQDDWTVCNADQDWGRSFASETRARVLWYASRPFEGLLPDGAHGGWLESDSSSHSASVLGFGNFDTERELLVPAQVRTPGMHQKKNLLAAAVALRAFGIEASVIADAMADFPGVPHRLEHIATIDDVQWYNDSAATVPDATIAALESFSQPVVLIAGGSDKNSDFEDLARHMIKAKRIILLKGSGTDRLRPLLDQLGIHTEDPCGSMHEAVRQAAETATAGDVVVLSPGCASFGLFLHEFDRGDQFRKEVMLLARKRGSCIKGDA